MVVFKYRSTYEKKCFVRIFRRRSKESFRIYILVHDQQSIFEDRIKISHTNSMYIYPHKRNVDALLEVGVIIKVVVFRTLCGVIARIALATDCCCCCWSTRPAPRPERGWMLSESSKKGAKKRVLNGTIQFFFGFWCMLLFSHLLAWSSPWSQDRLHSLWSWGIPQGKTQTTQGGTRIYHSWRNSCLHQKHIIVISGVSLRCARSIPVHTSHYSRLGKPTIPLATLDYQVYIKCSIYNYAYARPTQVNWKREAKTRKKEKGKKRKEKNV